MGDPSEERSAKPPAAPATGRAADRAVVAPVSAEVVLGPLSAPLADRLVAALEPESDGGVPRTSVSIQHRGDGKVVLKLGAPTTAALRAALNAHLRWVGLALRVNDLSTRGFPEREK